MRKEYSLSPCVEGGCCWRMRRDDSLTRAGSLIVSEVEVGSSWLVLGRDDVTVTARRESERVIWRLDRGVFGGTEM